MNKIYLLVLLSVASFSSITAQQPLNMKGSEYCSMKKMKQGQLNDLSLASPNSPKHSYDVLNYTMNINLMNNYTSPYPASFSANLIIKFQIDTALNAIVLNAVNASLVIDSVKLAGTGFSHVSDLLTVNLDRTYLPGEITQVQLYYRHNNINDGAVYTSNGFFFTDCEPEGARKWFPCYDSPSDKATVDITAKVPLNVKLGSNGRLQDSIVDANSITYHWISRDPVATYLTVITSKVNYQLDVVNWTNPNTSEVVPIRFYHNSNEDPTYIESIIGDMTTFYSGQFGDHPFEKNGFATLNNQFVWGGMENQTLTSLCPGCWYESLVAHEFAHQWFGDMVTCGTWADIFLNEGFATWTEAHWTEHTGGYSAYKDEIINNAGTYLSQNPGWAISDPDWAINTPDVNILFNFAITYEKGSCVLHQLRYVLGDSLFFSGMKAYATDTVNFKYKSATIPDFRDKMEEVSGQDLNWFFDEWIYAPNHPNYKNVYAIKHLDNGKWQVMFTAKQSALAPIYWQMPLELEINFMDLSDTIVKVFNSYNSQIYAFEFDKQPTNLVFDPNHQIVLKEGSTIVGNEEFETSANHIISIAPDPFITSATVNYRLNSSGNVKIYLYDQLGRKISELANEKQSAGSHTLTIDGNSLQPGLYFLHFESGNISETIKLLKSN